MHMSGKNTIILFLLIIQQSRFFFLRPSLSLPLPLSPSLFVSISWLFPHAHACSHHWLLTPWTCTIRRDPEPVGPGTHPSTTSYPTPPQIRVLVAHGRIRSVDMRNLLSTLGEEDAVAVARSTEVRT